MLARASSLCFILLALLGAALPTVPAARAQDAESYPGPPRPPRQRSALTLCFTGDNLPGSRMAGLIDQHGSDWPFALVCEPLRGADICFGNLECALTDYSRSTPGKSLESVRAGQNFLFKAAPQRSASLLAAAGFDILSLANNHAMDYCGEGLRDSITALDGAGVAWVGGGHNAAEAAAPRIIDCRGWRVGFLAYSLIVPPGSRAAADSPGINTLAKEFTPALQEAIGALRTQCDIVVVSFHWGKESSSSPQRYQREIAHSAIDAGADIVAGHHPHCLQPVELYGGGVIAYSLGNFLFTGASPLLQSCILRVTAGADGRVARVELLPVWVRNGRPELSADPRVTDYISRLCTTVGQAPQLDNGLLWFELPGR
jgi:poly-gamma-glutamate capsule biosynthesis protein CapA/YwtB (metallophosphatase superfamily)